MHPERSFIDFCILLNTFSNNFGEFFAGAGIRMFFLNLFPREALNFEVPGPLFCNSFRNLFWIPSRSLFLVIMGHQGSCVGARGLKFLRPNKKNRRRSCGGLRGAAARGGGALQRNNYLPREWILFFISSLQQFLKARLGILRIGVPRKFLLFS